MVILMEFGVRVFLCFLSLLEFILFFGLFIVKFVSLVFILLFIFLIGFFIFNLIFLLLLIILLKLLYVLFFIILGFGFLEGILGGVEIGRVGGGVRGVGGGVLVFFFNLVSIMIWLEEEFFILFIIVFGERDDVEISFIEINLFFN